MSIIKSNIIHSPHGFSTRCGGVGSGIFDSLNLGMNRGDDIEIVKENWKIFLRECGIEIDEFVCGKQVHGNVVHIAAPEDMRPAYGPGYMNECDGYVTNIKNIPIAIFTADCVPVILEDITHGVIGCIHCGWRSTVSDIEKETISKMTQLGAVPSSICISIGPAICKDCFEVGSEVTEAVDRLLCNDTDNLYIPCNNGKYLLDLRGTVKRRFMQLGVPENNIEIKKDCTMCNPKLFWSHRYTKGIRGSQANIIMLK